MWYKTSNSNNSKPLEIEKDTSVVFVRKDFVLVPASTTGEQTIPAHYEYMEDKIPADQWTTYLTAKGAMDLIEAMEG